VIILIAKWERGDRYQEEARDGEYQCCEEGAFCSEWESSRSSLREACTAQQFVFLIHLISRSAIYRGKYGREEMAKTRLRRLS
jgi:hypothetical protein